MSELARPRGTAVGAALSLSILLSVAPTAYSQTPEKVPVVVASKSFPENRLLGEIIAQLVERRTDVPVERKLNLGYSTIVYESLRAGEIDIYPEYTGTAWEEYLKIPEKVSDPLRAYLVVADRMAAELGIRWMRPFGFDNSFALAMSVDRSDALGVRTVSQLKPHEADLRVVISPDFFERQDGYRELARTYDLDTPNVRTMDHGLAYEAVRSGAADVIEVWTTDGKLARMKLRILDDDLGFFPPYHCAPVVREEALARHPELAEVLAELAFVIDNDRMRRLNAEIEELRDDPDPYARVAGGFLDELERAESAAGARAATRTGFLRFMTGRARATLALTGRHLMLTGAAVGLAVLVAVPLGIGLTRYEAAAPSVLGTAGVIQTIPSLALLAILIPIPMFGLGARTAVAALFLYALLPILRNTYAGIKGVDGQLVEAARAIGLSDGQILRKIELPLAVRTIMAGVRTSAVISIGVATLAAFVGAGGLGEPIVTGLQLNDTNWILSGALPAAALALLVDHVLGRVERAARPRGLGDE